MEPRPTMPIPPTQPSGRARGTLRRGGFTLLEILVVIGIIMLLVAIGVIAFGALDQTPRVTKTTLANLQSMLAEYETRTALREQPSYFYVNGGKSSPGANLWKSYASNTEGKAGPVTSGSPARYDWDAVANTQIVLQMLNRIPANKQTLTKLPGKQIHGLADAADNGKLLPDGGSEKRIDPPLVLDGWNNPIIFVGSGGLRDVNLVPRTSGTTGGGTSAGFEKPDQTITSAGVFPRGAVLPASARPFFASAGPDGDFRLGDDNLYSFEQ